MKSTRSHEPSPPPHERRRQTKSKFLLDRVFLRLHFPPDQIQTYRSHLTRSRRINRNLLLFPHVRFILVHLIEIIGPGNNAHDHGDPFLVRVRVVQVSFRLLSSTCTMHIFDDPPIIPRWLDWRLVSIIQPPPPRGEIVERLGSPLMDTVLFTVVMNETGIERERKNIISGYDL